MKKLGGVVFDMDGVVIDSEITHYTAICEAMGEGATASFDHFLEHCTGRDEVYAMSRMAELSDMEFENADMAQWSRNCSKETRCSCLLYTSPSPRDS